MGTLENVVALFQLVQLLSIYALRNAVKHRWYRYRYRTFRPLRVRERLIIGWAIFTGLFSIFMNGTFVVFAPWLSKPSVATQAWYLGFFKWLGSADRRYLSSDPYIVTSSALFAVVIGPACLFFAYLMYMRRAGRFLFGVILCTVLVFSQLLYYGTACALYFKPLDPRHASAFWLYVIFGNIVKLLIPAALLQYMLAESGRKLLRLKNYEIMDVIQRLAAGGGGDSTMNNNVTLDLEETGPPLPLTVDDRAANKPSLMALLHSRLGPISEQSNSLSPSPSRGISLRDSTEVDEAAVAHGRLLIAEDLSSASKAKSM